MHWLYMVPRDGQRPSFQVTSVRFDDADPPNANRQELKASSKRVYVAPVRYWILVWRRVRPCTRPSPRPTMLTQTPPFGVEASAAEIWHLSSVG